MGISWKFVMSVITVQFEFYIEKVVREIQFFVILHHFVSTL